MSDAHRIAWILKDCHLNGGNRAVFEISRAINKFGGDSRVFVIARADDEWKDYSGDAHDIAELRAYQPAAYIRTYFTVPVPAGIPCEILQVQYIQANYDRDGTTRDPRRELMTEYLRAESAVKLTVSHYLRRTLLSRGIPSTVVQPGVDHSCFYPRPRQDATFRVLVEGSMRGAKMVPECYGVIPPDVEVWGFGSEDHCMGATQMFVRPPSFTLSDMYSNCSAILKLATKEGHPLTLLEAMACGCVPICSDEGGHTDYCVDRFNSIICTTYSEATDAIEELRREPQFLQFLSQNALHTAAAFSWNRSAIRLLRVLKSYLRR